MRSGVIFLWALLFSMTSYSQNILEGYWGVKAGFNMNKISNIDLTNNFKPGFHAGVFANFQLNDNFSISHEVLLSVKGVSLTLSDNSRYAKSFTFLDLPMMLNFHPTRNFYISGGVQPSIYAYFKSPRADTILYNKDNVNTLEFSYLFGATMLLDNNVGFGIRFNGGLVPIFDVEGGTNKNYSLQVFLAYAVNKKKSRGRRR
jgi:hypothetical protein